MDFRRPFKLSVIMALLTYFITKIINAKNKLEERRIGTMISTVHSDTVQGIHDLSLLLPYFFMFLQFCNSTLYHGVYYVMSCYDKI